MSRMLVITLVFLVIFAGLGGAEEPQGTKSAAANVAANRKALKNIHLKLDQARVESDVHDACIDLLSIGDETSIPHLIGALRFFPKSEPGPNVGMICTQVHCVKALERITGEKAGFSQSAWKRWYASRNKSDDHGGSKDGRVTEAPLKR